MAFEVADEGVIVEGEVADSVCFNSIQGLGIS